MTLRDLTTVVLGLVSVLALVGSASAVATPGSPDPERPPPFQTVRPHELVLDPPEGSYTLAPIPGVRK